MIKLIGLSARPKKNSTDYIYEPIFIHVDKMKDTKQYVVVIFFSHCFDPIVPLNEIINSLRLNSTVDLICDVVVVR